jgi:phosphatidylserine decarboxylase
VSRRGLREARRYLLGVLVFEGAAAAAGLRLRGRAALACLPALLFFFRDPERELEPEGDAVYAAADGLVTAVEPVRDPWMGGEEAVRVSTFLSLHNVHVTRSPVAGRITDEEELPGGFRPAFLRRAEENRRRRLAIDGPRGRVVVSQVAGMVARRISPWVGLGDDLAPGRRLALIHFGSRVDVTLPADSVQVLVADGQRVRAGATVLARYKGVAPQGGAGEATRGAAEGERTIALTPGR